MYRSRFRANSKLQWDRLWFYGPPGSLALDHEGIEIQLYRQEEIVGSSKQEYRL